MRFYWKKYNSLTHSLIWNLVISLFPVGRNGILRLPKSSDSLGAQERKTHTYEQSAAKIYTVFFLEKKEIRELIKATNCSPSNQKDVCPKEISNPRPPSILYYTQLFVSIICEHHFAVCQMLKTKKSTIARLLEPSLPRSKKSTCLNFSILALEQRISRLLQSA